MKSSITKFLKTHTERDTHIPTQKKNENKDYSEYTEV